MGTDQTAHDSEEQFRLIADSAPVPMWVTALDRKRSFVNKAYVEFLGVSYDAAVDFDWRTILHPDDAAHVLAQSIAGEASLQTFTLEGRYKGADGTWHWLRSVSQPRWNGDGEHIGFIGIAHDITAAKEAEQALKLNEARLRLALTAGGVTDWYWDVLTDELHYSQHAIEALGIPEHARPTGAKMAAAVHPDDRDRFLATGELAIEDAKPYNLEFRIGRPGETEQWVATFGNPVTDGDGKVIGIMGMSQLITERKRNEQALRESEAALRALNADLERQVIERTQARGRSWQLSPDLMGALNPEGYFETSNPAWQQVLGWSESELARTSIFDLLHPDDKERTRDGFELTQRGQPAVNFENRYRCKDGSYRWISWIGVPEDGLVYCTGRDITDEKARDAELAVAQEALRQSQKLEAMGQLTGGVAHDFNNLLTPIVGSLDLLRRRGVGGEREQRMIDGALQSADRARILVQRLLAFARRQPLKVEPVDIGALVGGMADLIASTVGPRIVLETTVSPDTPHATADANQVEMALLNLSVNARDAMPDGGVLRISVSSEEVKPGWVTDLENGRYVRLTVSDNGTGMSAETLASAVEPFFSTKGIGKGTGLGLSMVHGLASQLGGALTLSSELGVGTTVDLWLPASTQDARPNVTPSTPAKAAPNTGIALVVDDEILVRMNSADMLGELGFEVVEANSGEEALQLIDNGLQPDFLITDQLMPGMTGAELALVVRQRIPGVAILIVSGYADIGSIAPEYANLTKPFLQSQLSAAIDGLIAARQ